jgi:undecaprenyl-diphosphatase
VPAWLQAFLLGLVQGLTEFLPVSSSGHLALVQQWLGEDFTFLEQALVFDLVLHLGTLLPVFYFYRRDLREILRSFFASSPLRHDGGPIAWLRADEHRWLASMVVVGTVPTGIMGIAFKDFFEARFHNTFDVCLELFISACLLYATKFFAERAEKVQAKLTVWVALLVGIAQGFAIAPGISRSGATIAVALLLGLPRELSARFSFLLSIPAILGAVVLMLKDGLSMQESSYGALVIGFFTSMVFGYLSLVMLVALVKRGGFHKFAYYLWPVSIGAWLYLR